ncbi:MAG: 2-oxo acid dehydrogenase subunit E2 [Firmicutes bacterium]|nr:2-oxo acid dehydrogenase subunit E2 [Bacillota bacterium]
MFFFKRKDAKKVKGLKGVAKLMPIFMPGREGNVNKYMFSESAKYFDEYIKLKKETYGITYTYRDLVLAILIRCFKCYPRLNRFITAQRFYQRNNIDVAFMVHQSLKCDKPEVSVKASFNGDETLDQIKQKLDSAIEVAIKSVSASDKTARRMARTPLLFLRMTLRILRIADYFGWLSKKFMFEVSPFHSSIFFADLKSIGLGPVSHHLYNFGNCSFFATLGKEQPMPIINDNGEIAIDKIFQVAISIDDRCVDGLYFAYMLRFIKKILKNMSILERAPLENEIRE